MADLLVRVRAYVGEFIERRFEKVKKDEVCDVEIGHGFEEWTSIRGWTWI